MKFTLPPDPFTANPTKALARSRLEFPLDPFFVYLSTGTHSANKNWKADVWFNINHPFSKMRDEDWFGAQLNSQNTAAYIKVGDTKSDAEAFLLGAEGHLELGKFKFIGTLLKTHVSILYSYGNFKIFGLKGQYRNLDFNEWNNAYIKSDSLVLTYKYHNFALGIPFYWDTPLLGLLGSITPYPLSIYISKDDHVLRNKTLSITGYGLGFATRLFIPSKSTKWFGMQPFLDYRIFHTWGKMKQEFYDDDPYSPDDETGLSFDKIDTDLGEWKITLGVEFLFRKEL